MIVDRNIPKHSTEVIHIKIQADGEEKISVTLTKNDMTDFDITYDEMDYSNIETRRVIWTILDEAKRVLGKSVNIDNRLLIQVSPADDGGCFLQFTQLPEATDTKRKRLIMKKEAEPLLFKAFDTNAFIDGVTSIKRLSENIKNYELCTYNNRLFAIIIPKLCFSDKICFVLSEYGEISAPSKEKIAEVYEYGQKLS